MVSNIEEVLRYLSLPSLPKTKWNGGSFETGVAELRMVDGSTSYGIATFDESNDSKPKIKKVFTTMQFVGMGEIFVVPEYMERNVEKMDFNDEASEQAAQNLIDEAREMEEDIYDEIDEVKVPDNEYSFDFIKTDAHGIAFIDSYNKRHKIKGRLPKTHDAIVARLATIYAKTKGEVK